MNKPELKLFLANKNQGLVFAPGYRLSLKESFQNLCLVAPTGSGKTTRFVIPNILNCSGSAVVTDPAGELFRLTSGDMQEKGFKVQVLNPADILGSLRFNPLSRFKTPQQLKQIATTIGGALHSTGDPFWSIMAVNIIYICLSALVRVPDPDLIHLGNVRRLLNHFGVDGQDINDFMQNYLDDLTFPEYKAFLAQDSKVIASILSSARAALDLWSDPDIVRLTAKDTIDLKALRNGKTIIYLIVPEHLVKYFSVVINLFYTACFEYCLQNEGGPVFFFLDEFGNLGRIQNFAGIATTLRKRNCSINIILQEISQLEAIYGKNEAKTIFAGGMANKLFFSGLDLETCQYIERSLGSTTEYATVFGGHTEKAPTISSPLLSVDKIRMLPKSEGLLFSGNQLPIIMKMPPFFEYKPWLKLTQKAPAKCVFDYSREEVKYIQL
jgi:type IV secretory pathway TraG/TraD family ATPase VirD4